jgi:hypothetical protein
MKKLSRYMPAKLIGYLLYQAAFLKETDFVFIFTKAR